MHPLAPGGKLPPANCRRCAPTTPDRPNSQYIEHATDDCLCIATGGHCHGVRAATTDPSRIDRWWSAEPRFGIGIACGPSGLVILDIDNHGTAPPKDGQYLPGVQLDGDTSRFENGWDSIAALCAVRNSALPWLEPPTMSVLTPSGGLHAWFRVKDADQWRQGAGRLGWQIDLKAGWGYGIVPGTVTRSGTYQALGDCRTVAPLPTWLGADLKRSGHHKGSQQARPSHTTRRLLARIQRPKGDRYVAAAVTAEVERVTSAASGTRNETVFSAALSLGRFIPTGHLSESEVQDLLGAAAQSAGLAESEARSAVQSGIRVGITKGRAA